MVMQSKPDLKYTKLRVTIGHDYDPTAMVLFYDTYGVCFGNMNIPRQNADEAIIRFMPDIEVIVTGFTPGREALIACKKAGVKVKRRTFKMKGKVG